MNDRVRAGLCVSGPYKFSSTQTFIQINTDSYKIDSDQYKRCYEAGQELDKMAMQGLIRIVTNLHNST